MWKAWILKLITSLSTSILQTYMKNVRYIYITKPSVKHSPTKKISCAQILRLKTKIFTKKFICLQISMGSSVVPTSTNIHSATMWGYRMLSWRPAWGDERSGKVAREGQGYPCYQHDMMMMMVLMTFSS